ncbi:MAG: GGDEF-domain containing protein [Frankiales bacterium]|nr:GGDEF-domain containing protein [Frankiales bacterium]
MSVPERPSLLSLSMFSAFWWLSVLGGWALLATAVAKVATSSLTIAGWPLAMTAVLLVVLELLPLVEGRGHDPQGVVMSTAFVCGMLFLWGLWPAVLVVSVAAFASDLNVKKSAWKLLFNVGQYNLSVAAGWLVMLATNHTSSLQHPLAHFAGRDLLWMVGVWIAYFVTNDVLVSGVLAWTDSFLAVVLDDLLHYTMMTFAVLALSPLIVVLAQTAWVVMPLLLIPLVLVYKTAQMSLDKEHQAGHDSLTGLPNRKSLRNALEESLSRARRDQQPFGLLLIDLDHFKEVNDTLGHHVGDQILIHFADRLRASVRDADHVARLGGDEFAVIVSDAEESEVRTLAERIRTSLVDPIAHDGMLFDIEASIGIAMHPEQGHEPDDLMRLADVAMYDAKETRTGIATYAAARDRHSADRLGLLGELRQALDDGDIELHYQPKVAMRDSSLMGMEALIRWEHPQRGYISPDEFIPLAERSGIMPLLTERVIELALGQLSDWRCDGLPVPVAVNVSVSDLAGPRLVELVSAGLRENHLMPGMLQLEITERVVAEDSLNLDSVFRALAKMGVSLSLDDFGTGYSSLLRLQSLPVDEIKIDRAFVSRLADTSDGSGIVQAVIDLAHARGLPAIAEGVETAQEWDVLQSLGCDGAQGWHIAAPMPARAATEWIRERIALTGTVIASAAKF